MRILYGVCGEGFGHSSRAKVILQHLNDKGHQILVLTYGQAYPILHPRFPTLKIEGFSIEFEKNKLSIPKTLAKANKVLINNIKNWQLIKNALNSFNPELCITDMEPLVPVISFWKNIPLISIDNQHRLTHLPLKVPKEYLKDYLIAKSVVDRYVSRAEAFIILSFTKGKPKSKNAFIVSPILRNEVTQLKTSDDNSILVYLTKPNQELISLLRRLPYKFIVYGLDVEKAESNLQFKKTGPNFLNDLIKSKAVIATAGFTLMGESLYLKKPYFAIPLQGQFEQTLNALFLKQAGYGDFSETPSLEQLTSFLSNLPKYKKALSKYQSKPDEAIKVLDKIIKNIEQKGY